MSNSPSWTAGHELHPHVSRRDFAHRPSKTAKTEGGSPADASRMSWSWHVGRFAGIDVYIHATFVLLIAWLVMIHMSHGSTPAQTLFGILFFMALFACVVLHEFGHALTARRFGIKTRDITLLPIGGVARLERIPREPWQELVVALAGPAVNVVIAGAIFLLLWATGMPLRSGGETLPGIGDNPLASMMWMNLMLALFNMLPAFPMDGGRVVRALLAMRIPRVKATRFASALGQIMAVVFGILGLAGGQPFLLLIALFVYLGASQEYQTIRWETAVEGLTVRNAMMTNYRTVLSTDPLSRAVSLLLHGSQHDFPVLDENFRVVGLLLRQDLIAALSHDGGAARPVSSAMRSSEVTASPDEPLERVFERMQVAQLPVVPVFDNDGKLVGLLTMENVAEVVMVRNALEKAQTEK